MLSVGGRVVGRLHDRVTARRDGASPTGHASPIQTYLIVLVSKMFRPILYFLSSFVSYNIEFSLPYPYNLLFYHLRCLYVQI